MQLKSSFQPPIMKQNVQYMVIHVVGDQNYDQRVEINLSGSVSCCLDTRHPNALDRPPKSKLVQTSLPGAKACALYYTT